jgi:hypothetical protein
MSNQIVFRISDRLIGLIGLCITFIGLFLPWWVWATPYYALREQVYAATAAIYPYYPIYEIGIIGAGWQSSLATLLAAYALFTETKRRPGFLAVSSLMVFYNVGSILAMFFMYDYYYYRPILGPGIFVSLIGGIFFLISALLGLSQARKKGVNFCRKCGSSILDSYQFCPYCGEGINYSKE